MRQQNGALILIWKVRSQTVSSSDDKLKTELIKTLRWTEHDLYFSQQHCRSMMVRSKLNSGVQALTFLLPP